ncbi:MAG: N5-carboxyaminoimidazole ribonucleotide synthase [marine bacterium B5-7]|nr:MAG: N5-carboxyaminoimidazole ribonucleotide synthase [marine bacterium B5-7]
MSLSEKSTDTNADESTILGIVGGGQLGRMMIQAARKLGVECVVLDPDPDCPAARLGARHIPGSLFDAEALERLVRESNVTTFEIEALDAECLAGLAAQGHCIRPRPDTLKMIQDKLWQKRFLSDHGLPTARFEPMPDVADKDDSSTADASRCEHIALFGLPCVQKLRRGGYDGRGVRILKKPDDLADVLSEPSLVEEFIVAERELAVVGARSINGEIRCYAVVDMTLGETTNMLEMLTAPADIPPEIAESALDLGRRTIEALNDVGIFAIELFLTADKQLLVNEISPRTHNSGHFTIDACETSQFEQHVRAVTGMALGCTRQHHPAAMINLNGAPGYSGEPILEGEQQARQMAGVHIHLYGKRECRPHRKMGHVTVLGESLEDAMETARKLEKILRIRGRDPVQTRNQITSGD